MDIGLIIGIAAALAIVSYLNNKMVKDYKEKERKEELEKKLKVDFELTPKEIKVVKKKKLKNQKKND